MIPALDFWDYVTFAALFVVSITGLVALVFILGLPAGNNGSAEDAEDRLYYARLVG